MSLTANQVLDRVSMSDLLSANGVQLPRRGNRVPECPFCKSKSNAFGYSEAKGVWHCHSCGAGGGKIAFVAKVRGITPKDSLEWIARLAGTPLDQWDRDQEQRHALALKQAEGDGRDLVAWRARVIEKLRNRRDVLQLLYWWTIRVQATRHEAELWERIVDYDRKIQWHRDAPWPWLAELYKQAQQRRRTA